MVMKPKQIDDVTLAFPGSVEHLMPTRSEIPKEFQRNGGTKWNRFFGDMFFSGISAEDLRPKDGIDKTEALRHITAISRSFEPKHEHKEAAVAYLMSQWFDDSSTWTPTERKQC